MKRCWMMMVRIPLTMLLLLGDDYNAKGFHVYLGSASLPSISPISPHYLSANPSFNVSAWLCQSTDPTMCKIDASCRGKIAFQMFVSSNLHFCSDRLMANDCEKVGCLGVISHRSTAPSIGGWMAMENWWLPKHQFTNIPMVALGTGRSDPHIEWMVTHWNDTAGLRIHMWSGEHNPAADVVSSPVFILLNVVATLNSIFNVYLSSKKINIFMISKEKPPTSFWLVLVPELIANLVRILFFTSTISSATFLSGGAGGMYLPWTIYRFLVTVHSDLGSVSNAAIALILFDTYTKFANATSEASLRRARYITYTIVVWTAAVAVLDIVLSVYAALWAELIPYAVTVAILLVLSIPSSWAFVRYGGRVARIMTSNTCQVVSETQRQERRNFGIRVRFSGFVMIASDINLVLFSVLGPRSIAMWLNLFVLLVFGNNVISTAQILSVRTRIQSTSSSTGDNKPKPRPAAAVHPHPLPPRHLNH